MAIGRFFGPIKARFRQNLVPQSSARERTGTVDVLDQLACEYTSKSDLTKSPIPSDRLLFASCPTRKLFDGVAYQCLGV